MNLIFDDNIEMKYEHLYRAAFGCGRLGDPWEEADAGYFDEVFRDINKLNDAKASLYRILHKLIFDNYKGKPLSNKLIEIEKKISEIKTQENSIEIIDDTIKIVNDDTTKLRFAQV